MTDQAASGGAPSPGIQFAIDGSNPEARYEAVRLGPRWNGWETPVVTRPTFETLLRTEDPAGEWYRLTFDEKGIATLQYLQDPGYEDLILEPNTNGYYDLGELGWVFFCPEVEPVIPEGAAAVQGIGAQSSPPTIVGLTTIGLNFNGTTTGATGGDTSDGI